MPHFTHDGVEISFLDEGQGEPIVFVHGFASTKEINWVYTSWVSALTQAGRRVIALDNRGHGRSSKLYDRAAYRIGLMAGDVLELLDQLKIQRADVMGYSLGARITAFLSLEHAERVRSAVFGGLGINMVEGTGPPKVIAEALLAPSRDAVTDPVGHMYRVFAEKTRSDLRALAACIEGSRQRLTREDAGRIAVPVLVAVGSRDEVGGSAEELAALVPGATALVIPDRDHMLAVGDRAFKAGVLDFLAGRP
jgi:pimeloyl-ACP methyl ester carboxylesterase